MITAEVTISPERLRALKHPMEFVGLEWQTYEQISADIGESSPLHLTFRKGTLTVMPVTELHELLTSILYDFIRFSGFALGIDVISTGKATMRSERRLYGVEPDLSFFVSKADIHQTKNYVPNELELAPDIVCEIDIHHRSDDKFEIYAEFGISEFWQYDGTRLKMFKLQTGGTYLEIGHSEELPVLSSIVLTEFLNRGQKEKQFVVLTDFQTWLNGEKTR